MKVDITKHPDPNLFQKRKKFIIGFVFFLSWTFVAIGIALFAVSRDGEQLNKMGDIALGVLVASAIGVTWFGNRLQAFKKLYPPQKEKLVTLRTTHEAIEKYCSGIDTMTREMVRGEYEACEDYSEKHEASVPFI